MESRTKHLVAAVAVGVVARAAVFNKVAVNGDTGLYLYDAKQLLWGRRLMVDFPSRSPVFEYALAGVLSLGQSPIVSARVFMATVGIALGIAIYAFTRTLHSHRSGLVAMLFFYLSPFSLVWGLWVKTEQAAGLFVLVAFTIALWYLDRDQLSTAVITILGLLFAVAFLIRRVAIVHVAAFALFVFWYQYRQHDRVSRTIIHATGVVSVMAAVLGIAYVALARGDLSVAVDIASQHAGSLVTSSGQGGIGYVPIQDPKAVTAEARDGLLFQICQKCGRNTVIVSLQTALVTSPVLVSLLVFIRSYTEEAGFWGQVVLPVALVIPAALGGIQAAFAGFYSRTVGAIALIATVVILWKLDIGDWKELWKPVYGLPVLVLLGLAAGYLYRDRILYVTYFQDFYPYIVALASIAVVETVDRNRDIDVFRLTVITFVAMMFIATASVNAYPYQTNELDSDSHWFTIELIQEYGDDIGRRTAPGERVLTAQPLYVIETDRRIVSNLSRKYYLFEGWPGSPPTAAAEKDIIDDMDRAPVAIHDHELDRVLNHSDRIRSAFDSRYCPMDNELYNETGGELYLKRSSDTC